jgi:hypothetical protein
LSPQATLVSSAVGQIQLRLIKNKLRILMVEDELRDATLVEHSLKQGGFDCSFKRV